jgi:single-stranded-DNA-specific exonuclease
MADRGYLALGEVVVAWTARRVPYATVCTLRDTLEIPEALAWTLARRGLDTPELARAFIDADGPLDPPETLHGVAEIADRLILALDRGARIAIHGDYDCDGVCSTAVLARPLRAAGADVVTYLPSRFTDGYGIRLETVERLADDGVAVLVCVDCGTSAVDALTRAVELGIEPVVLDHHLAGGVRPPGLIANPALGQAPDDAPAAAGVVFAVVRALAERLGPQLVWPDPDRELDLVALATIADAVPLVGQNRRLVIRGIAEMRTSPRAGIRALCHAAGIDPRTLDARALGYSLAPVINAAGRLRHPEDALALLLEDDFERARAIAYELWELNAQRREVEQAITAEAIAQIEASPPEIRDANAIVAIGDGWHEGVIGIVASRLVDHFDRPALVLTRDEDIAKGSGRSLDGLDLHDLVGRASGRLSRWGGHAGAVGLQLPVDQVAPFREEFLGAATSLGPVLERARIRPIDAIVGARELTLETAEAFEALAPYGRGNPQPRLLMPACTAAAAGTMGKAGRHLNVRLQCGGAHLRAVGFGHGHRARDIADGERVDAHVALGIERYQGLVGPRVSIDRLDVVRAPALAGTTCAPACDLACTQRITLSKVRAGIASAVAEPELPHVTGPPLAIDDQRAYGTALVRIAALAGADAGVVVIVADVPRRRSMLDDVLHPQRLGVELAVLGSVRCAAAPAAERLAQAARRASIAVVDYATLAQITLPEAAHLVVLDPPQDAGQAGWLRARAAGRFVHLAWTDHEVEFARLIAAERWDLRPLARQIWRDLGAHPAWGWDAACERALLGGDGAIRHPDAVADTLGAFVELGLIACDPAGIRILQPAERRPLEHAERVAAATERLAQATAYLDRALTLDLFAPHYDMLPIPGPEQDVL